MKIHIVQKGDTLWKIAKKYGVNFEELKKMNAQLSNPDMIMPGMKIKVPTSGGNINKEVGGAKVSYGSNPKEHPYTNQKPIHKEAPVAPMKEMPKKEAPVKEVPKPIYAPKIPQPVIPEIDINNYYMMNMANMQMQSQPQAPPVPPKPKEIPKEEPKAEKPIEGGQPEPMYCVPVTPVMPGSGFCPPGPGHMMPHHMMPQVQGAYTMPMQQPMMQGVSPAMMHHMGYDEESSSSSSYMPMMHQQPMSYHHGNPQGVKGIQDNPNYGGMPQDPMGQMPAMNYPPMGYPYPGNCVPTSQVMPGSGFGPMGSPRMEHGGYPMQQVQGTMSHESPEMMQQPMMQPVQQPMQQPMQSYPMEEDCGCGCGGPSYGQSYPMPYHHHMHMATPYGYGGGQPGYGMPMQQQYGMGQPGMQAPYGMGQPGMGMPGQGVGYGMPGQFPGMPRIDGDENDF
ncbi:LysM peptidoglycan-binding domain-containing protein [Falsibacillus albus]|uniref:LysM peptidoglycan-binding domain-containing protein n=1 Tax=Falsibacillus albus TaxID=2478915 RepID=A0A3L7K704_9BACI|nr:SafA/ExsA family spore coat assembly protein [Falsibacillus albus]RLQ98079.1 LysM peptidoglycan-binding domain-containing protein [Falsibacillus albus]